MPASNGTKTGKGTSFPRHSDLWLTLTAKLDAVTALLDKLQLDLDKHTLTPHRMTLSPTMKEASGLFLRKIERVATLEELKIYGRNEDDSDPIYTKEVQRQLANSKSRAEVTF